jgi:serine/threonine protein kinase
LQVFVEGSRLTTALDVYAFGIIMYELYCCRRPYSGQAKDHIAKR